MSQLAERLQFYFKRSNYRSLAALARATQAYTSISTSYIKQLLGGGRTNPAYEKVIALASALDLSVYETNDLLQAAGYPAQPVVSYDEATPQIRRILDALNNLRRSPAVSLESFERVAGGIVQMVDGMRLALNIGALPESVGSTPIAEPTPEATLRALPAADLNPEESMIDDLLGEILARSEDERVDGLFAVLETAAREERWETKRRLAEALPKLVELRPERTLQLASILRTDYHLEYRADIRRRVVEAVPVMAQFALAESLALLDRYERDEVYIAMATVEVLYDMQNEGLIKAETAAQYRSRLRFDEPLHQEVIAYLSRLLDETRTDPETTLKSLRARRDDPERLIKICIQRTAPRLLPHNAKAALDLMRYFLRRDKSGQPVEHQNLRRPVSKALPQIIDILADAPSKAIREMIAEMVQSLVQDPDIHVRRALGDALERLVSTSPELGLSLMEPMIFDPDPYVRQRTWRAVFELDKFYPDQAHDYYIKLLTRSR